MKCGARPGRLPSLAGSDARLLEEYLPRLPSREDVLTQVEGVLGELASSSDPMVVLLVAEWGEGKTSIYNAKVKPWLETRGWLAVEVSASTLLGYMEELRNRMRDKAPEYLLTAALFAAMREQQPLLVPDPGEYGSARDYVAACVRRVSAAGRGVVFLVDEFEDIVAARSEEIVGLTVAGLVGLVNGGVAPVSVACRDRRIEPCSPGSLHLFLALTPPAYSKLMSFKDFATIASRLKRRVRMINVRSLTRSESLQFIKALARYTFGDAGLRGFLSNPSLANALASAGLGNMGALVSAFRMLAGYAAERGERLCGGRAVLLSAGDMVRLLSGLRLSIGGAEIPALNQELYSRLMKTVEARARLSGSNPKMATGFMETLIAQHIMIDGRWGRLVAELNEAAGESWIRRELGVQRLIYRVRLVDAEEALKVFREAAEEASKTVPRLAQVLLHVGDQIVHIAPDETLKAGIPGEEELVDLVMDASPVELSRQEAEELAEVLRGRLAGLTGVDAVMLSPKLSKTLYVSPELQYLDFIADRLERLRVNRRVYAEADQRHVLLAAIAAASATYRLVEQPTLQGSWAARMTIELHLGHARPRANLLLAAVAGELGQSDAEKIERLVMTCILANWRPHAVVVLYYGSLDPEAERRLREVEEKFFVKIIPVRIPTMVMKVRLSALGIKVMDAADTLEEAAALAAKLPHDQALQEELGLDTYRLEHFLSEAGELLDPETLKAALRAGVSGRPLMITDPKLAYEVERPSELAGALRYYLVVPSPKASPRDALTTAYEYVMRYHVYRRGGGPDSRGILSPDIDRREVSTLEKYTALLIANKMLERLNGEMKIDTLSPMEASVLEAIRQAGGERDWVQGRQVWRCLVDATTNPGTRRMLLQLLVYRGLVEAQGRRIDPDKTRLRIRQPREIRDRIRELREELEELAGDPDAAWAYIVSAKLRGYRAGCLRGLVEKASTLLDAAEEALTAGNMLMAARLVRTVEDLVEYYREDIVERLVKPAAETARSLAARLREALEELEELRGAVEELASSYVFEEPVTVRVEAVEALKEAIKAIGEVEALELSEEELEARVAAMWRKALAKNPREPGRETPFYIGGLGPKILYNYKLWLLYEKLRGMGVVEDYGSTSPGGMAAAAAERLKTIASTLQSCIEQYNQLAADLHAIASRLASLGIEAGGVETRPPRLKPSSTILGLDELEKSINEWRRRLDEATAGIRALREALARLEKAVERVRSAASRLEEEAEEAERLAGEAECTSPLLAKTLMEEATAARERAEKALDSLSLAGISLDVDSVSSAASRLEGLASELEQAVAGLRARVREAEKRVREEYEKMRLEYSALAAAIGYREPPPSDACRLAAGLEELRRRVMEAGILTREEVEAYMALQEAKKTMGDLLLSTASRIIAEKLGWKPEEARRRLISLIEKGIIEPRL